MDNLPKRKPLRLKNYDYSQNGCYFVTVCTYQKQNLFETSIVGNDLRVVPSNFRANQIIEKWLFEIENKFNVKIDYYIIMPNHIHFILTMLDEQEKHTTERHTGRSLQNIMQWFKTMTTNEYIDCAKNGALQPFNKKIWQKSYYEHIIRNDTDYIKTVEYMLNNPLKRELENHNQP